MLRKRGESQYYFQVYDPGWDASIVSKYFTYDFKGTFIESGSEPLPEHHRIS